MRARLVATALGLAVLAGCGAPAPPSTADGTPIDPYPSEAVDYCESNHGEVQYRHPTYGTNNDESAWVPLGRAIATCKLETLGDDTAIVVDLNTLYSENPTLAALAYLQSSTPADLRPSGNPAAAICSALGGTSAFGPGVNGGGLADPDDADFAVFAPCAFADGSFIEEWGIAYHQEGTIRGADLEPLFRFDVSKAPHVYD